MKKLVVVTFAELAALPPADLFAEGQAIPKSSAAIENAKDKQVKNLHRFAKVVAALKRLYTAEQNAQRISGDLPFSSKKKEPGFFEQNCKGSLPGRVEAIANLFNRTVLTLGENGKPLLDEKFFDSARIDWLERANVILSDAMDEHGDPAWKTCDDVVHTLNALAGQPFNLGDTLGTLKEIRTSQKERLDGAPAADGATPAVVATADGEATALTFDIAVAFIRAQFDAAGGMKPERQAELCAGLYAINDSWANNSLNDTRRAELDAQVSAALEAGIDVGIQITRGEAQPA